MAKHATVNIDTIKEDFFVRQRLDDDHVLQLATLYEAGTDLPRLLVTDERSLIDGRHRLAALKLLNKKSVNVTYSPESDRATHLAEALRANLGGALPPTNADIIYAITQMLESGMSYGVIIKNFTKIWPAKVVRDYCDHAQGNLTKNRIVKARNAVLDGMTVQEAAALHKIKIETLKDAIGGKRKKRTDTMAIKGAFSAIFRARGASLGHTSRKLMQMFEDGEISWKNVDAVLTHYEELCHGTELSAKGLRRRFEALKQQMESSQ